MNRPRTWWIIFALLFTLLFTLLPTALAQQGEGYWYTVQPGDSWWSISERTGVPIGVLQAHNPQAIRPNLWLWRGERLWIPAPARQQKQQGYWYVVQPGDTWLGLAIRTGVSVSVLKRLNPHAVHPNDWMWAGDRIFIPSAAPVPPAPPASPTPPPTPERPPTPTPPPSPTSPPTPTAGPGTTSPTQPVPTKPVSRATPPVDVPCPDTGDAAVSLLSRVLALTSASTELTTGWMEACGLVRDAAMPVEVADVNRDGRPDVAVVLQSSDPQTGEPRDTLVVLLALGEGYADIFHPAVQGTVDILAFRDVNADGRVDLLWKETVCRGSDCITTVRVYSWMNPSVKFAPFSDGEIGMANARVWLEDVTPDDGDEIVLHGGIIHAISAGPQRTWTEVWASQAGQPYRLASRTYDPSDCLYHWVLDGNRALSEGRAEDAISIFQTVVGDRNLVACWFRPDEETELRTFGWFRLALTYAYAGYPDMVRTVVNQASEAFPDAAYIEALRTWYQTYEKEQDAGKACRAFAPYVQKHPILWEMLADYGYANPTFGPTDVCPDLSATYAARVVACPHDLDKALERAEVVLNEQQGDVIQLYEVTRSCGYAVGDYSDVGAEDVDDDGSQEVFVILNTGWDREHPQAVLAAFHLRDGTYTLAWQKRFVGEAHLLALEDLNDDGAGDVAWTVRTCESAQDAKKCAVEAFVYTWLDGAYQDWVDGQAIARDARVFFEERGPGSGDELVLHEELPEAVSGAEVPAREFIWTSDAGAPYRLYDVVYKGTRCKRYALHEAEVALLTGPRYGWDRAIERFTRVVEDSTLALCKEGEARQSEDALLTGLAYFHQALAYAYNGQVQEAKAALDKLQANADAQALWAAIAQAWWTTYERTQDMEAACAAAVEQAKQHTDLVASLNEYPVPDLLPAQAEGLCPVLTP